MTTPILDSIEATGIVNFHLNRDENVLLYGRDGYIPQKLTKEEVIALAEELNYIAKTQMK